ncbi:MAG: hypothetical protein JXB49_31345 [Bacteroidales bacterium]|nr:hypothetical protein [Bacteroidales bacterium]
MIKIYDNLCDGYALHISKFGFVFITKGEEAANNLPDFPIHKDERILTVQPTASFNVDVILVTSDKRKFRINLNNIFHGSSARNTWIPIVNLSVGEYLISAACHGPLFLKNNSTSTREPYAS